MRILCILSFLFLFSCEQNSDKYSGLNSNDENENLEAKWIQIDTTHSVYSIIQLISPWKKQDTSQLICVQEYSLFEKLGLLDSFSGSTIIQVPVQNVISSSATHVGFIDAVGELNTISAHAQVEYIFNPEFQERLQQKLIQPLDGIELINAEEILIDIQPDVIFINSFAEESEGIKTLRKLGVPIIPIAEWKENHPIGRLQWLRVFGELYQKRSEVNTYIDSITFEYQKRMKQVFDVQHLEVLSGYDYKGTWYMPGGNSFLGKLFEAAEFQYAYFDDESTGSIGLNIEHILTKHAKADVWLFPGAYQSISQILSDQDLLKGIQPITTESIYQVNLKASEQKLYKFDYWEKGVVHPEWILDDLIHINKGEVDDLIFFSKLPK